jgi:hypothetical protein
VASRGTVPTAYSLAVMGLDHSERILLDGHLAVAREVHPRAKFDPHGKRDGSATPDSYQTRGLGPHHGRELTEPGFILWRQLVPPSRGWAASGALERNLDHPDRMT